MLSLFGKPDASLLERLKESVRRTRSELSARVGDLLAGGRKVDPECLAELEKTLLSADLGVRTTREILDRVREKAERQALNSPEQLKAELQMQLLSIFEALERSPDGQPQPPQVVFVVGVNGTGKTTTIGKLAYRLRQQGRTVLLAAADTFRAAAIEQLEIWAQRVQADLVRQKPGADPAAVVFDALTAARARGSDVVFVDTAGRLHTKSNLMAELEKMKHVAGRLIPGAPHEILLVLDATTGQNGLVQAREFTAHLGVTGLVLTKLDGTAKGGIVVAIARELGLPIRFVGTGEQADDLVPFDPQTFVHSLFD
ncbi:MAG: signal recognition particle-docking protein FtsY [Firmicutes bacterium]|nr:signal recognition particle-docking protein FtsY [Bacillota bacterium]